MNVIKRLEKKCAEEFELDKRNAAELAYAIATLAKDNKDLEKAREYALKAIEMFETLQIQTLDEAAAKNNIIEGVVIPELMHEGVIRERFKDILS